MKRFVVPTILLGLWLLAWADNTGVLVWSRQELYGTGRLCSYFIGFSIETSVPPTVLRQPVPAARTRLKCIVSA